MSDRREFFRRAAAVTVGFAGRESGLVFAQQRAAKIPTSSTATLMAEFGLKYPIFCAGMGGGLTTPELAIAISNAGAVGALGAGTTTDPVDVRQRVSRIKSGTNRPFAVNYLLAFDLVTLPAALEAGAPIIQFAWGIPTEETVAAIRKAGAKMGIQIGSVAGARRALDVGGGLSYLSRHRIRWPCAGHEATL